MKRKILYAIVILLVFLFIFTFVKKNTNIVNKTGNYYIVDERFFNEPVDVRSFVTPYEYSIQQQALKLKTDDTLATIINTYNFIEENYHYVPDNMEIYDNGIKILNGGDDTWNFPIMTLAMKHQKDGLWVDCEDGTFLLTSLLRAEGIEAYANIGTITITGGIYGHAWTTVVYNNKEYLLETVLGKPLQYLSEVPSNYKADYKFNEKEFISITRTNLSVVYPPLPPQAVKNLEELLYEKGNN